MIIFRCNLRMRKYLGHIVPFLAPEQMTKKPVPAGHPNCEMGAQGQVKGQGLNRNGEAGIRRHMAEADA